MADWDPVPAPNDGWAPVAQPQPTGPGTRMLDFVKDVAAAPFRVAGTAADVGSRLSAALDPSQAGAPLPEYGEHNFVPPALQHAPVVLGPIETQIRNQSTLGGELIKSLHGPAIDTIKENAGPAAALTGAVAGAPGLVRGGAAAMNGAVDALEGMGVAAEPKTVPGGPPNPINEVHAAGYKFRPSDVQARNPSMTSVPGSIRESITSSPEQTQQIVRDNSALSTRLIGEDIGVPNATKLTPAHYAAARLAPGAAYDRVGEAVGTIGKAATGAADTLQTLAGDQSAQAMPALARQQAARIAEGLRNGQYTGPQIINDISYFRQVGGAGRAAANALEDELGAQVQAKAPAMSGDYENARTTFAKIQNAEDATTGGLIDAADYRRLAEREPRLMTGNSRLVALAGGEIPTVTALPRAGADASPVKGTLYDTVMNAAARGAAKVPGLNITRPGLQRKIAAAAPATGPIPTGPYQRGLGAALAGEQ